MADASLVSLADVTDWLRVNRLGLTALQLYEELTSCDSTDNSSVNATQRSELLSVAEASLTQPGPSLPQAGEAPDPQGSSSSRTVEDDLETCMLRAIKHYRENHSASELACLMQTHALLSSDDSGTSPVHLDSVTLNEMRTSMRDTTRRWQAADQQQKRLLSLLAQSLPTLVSAIDPMQRDSLLPLLKVVAVSGSTSSARDAARHLMLTLYKRPTAVQRAEMARAYLQVAQDAPSQRALEQEVIPQLYSLVNDSKWERRVLSLDCTAALAPLLSTLPNVRHQLTQGVLKPLSEDESASVRREVPVCLCGLWSAAFDADGAASSADPAADQADTPNAHGDDDTSDGPIGTPEQLTYAMELIIQLSVDSLSNTVRHAAQTQLREVMYPLCLRRHRLISTCVPLLLSFLADEIKPLCALDTAGMTSSHAGPTQRSEASFYLRNSLTLLKLTRDALRCLQAEIVNIREHAPSAAAERALNVIRRLYLQDTLPTAYSLLPLCLNDAAPAAGGARATSTALLFEPLSPPSPHTRGSLLASLALVMASIAPVLDETWWTGIRKFLCASIHLDLDDEASPPLVSSAPRTAEESATHRRCRLMFFYAFCIGVGGERTTGSSERESATPPAAVCEGFGAEAIRLILRTFPGSDSRLANESLDTCARCLAVLGASALDDPSVAPGMNALLWMCTGAASVAVRSQAVTLISRTCNHLRSDDVKVSLICPPLLALIKDSAYVVQEAAVRCLFRVGAFLPGTIAQEKALRPVMDVVQSAGCTSDLTASFLQYVEELVKDMPAEPRENQLYLLLSVLMDQLADQQTKRVMQLKRSGTSTPASGAVSVPVACPVEAPEQERWETAMLALQSLLSNILHCAVVSPHLVAKFLLPGIKHLASDSVQQVCSSTLRSRWTRLDKAYDLFMENSRSPGAVAAQNATNLLNRVRDEFKKRF